MSEAARPFPSHSPAARRGDVLQPLAAALIALALGFAVQPVTGTRPDWDLVLRILDKLWTVTLVGAIGLVAGRLIWLALVVRSPRPTRDLVGWLRRLALPDGPLPALATTVGTFFVFAMGVGVLKGAIAVLAPFSWDIALSRLDRVLHFGRLPHEWLAPLLAWPLALSALNILYHVWFFLQIGSIFAIAFAARDLRRQFLLAYFLTWLVGGFLIAMAVSSAGPVYVARLGLGDAYVPLTDALAAAARDYPMWALDVQERLWSGFTGASTGSAGISAFPSMHVATATLFVLAARRVGRPLFLASLAFWATTLLGSIVLAWHYAVDGYAGTLIAMVIWRGVGRRQGHLAIGGSDISTASGLWPVSSPNRVPRS